VRVPSGTSRGTCACQSSWSRGTWNQASAAHQRKLLGRKTRRDDDAAAASCTRRQPGAASRATSPACARDVAGAVMHDRGTMHSGATGTHLRRRRRSTRMRRIQSTLVGRRASRVPFRLPAASRSAHACERRCPATPAGASAHRCPSGGPCAWPPALWRRGSASESASAHARQRRSMAARVRGLHSPSAACGSRSRPSPACGCFALHASARRRLSASLRAGSSGSTPAAGRRETLSPRGW
jgi:hypothetical protein